MFATLFLVFVSLFLYTHLTLSFFKSLNTGSRDIGNASSHFCIPLLTLPFLFLKAKTLAQETLATLSSVSTDQLVLFLQICDQVLGLEDELEESKWRLGSVQAVLQGEALETAFQQIGKHEVGLSLSVYLHLPVCCLRIFLYLVIIAFLLYLHFEHILNTV